MVHADLAVLRHSQAEYARRLHRLIDTVGRSSALCLLFPACESGRNSELAVATTFGVNLI
jgi:hypothetical protein